MSAKSALKIPQEVLSLIQDLESLTNAMPGNVAFNFGEIVGEDNFDGTVINDPSVVRITNDKSALASELHRLGVGAPFQALSELFEHEGGISYNEFERSFPHGAILNSGEGSATIADMEGLMKHFHKMEAMQKDGVLIARNGQPMHNVTVAPALRVDPYTGKTLTVRSRQHPDAPGIVGGVFQNTATGALHQRAAHDAHRVAKMLGIDVATLTIQYTDGKCQVVDVTTQIVDTLLPYLEEIARFTAAAEIIE